jgi:hypothetical protein
MSSSDVSKWHHSRSFTSGYLPLENDKILEVLNAEVLKWTRDVRSERSLREHSHLSIYSSGRIA